MGRSASRRFQTATRLAWHWPGNPIRHAGAVMNRLRQERAFALERILSRLRGLGSISAEEVTERLGIRHPEFLIGELIDAGYPIQTVGHTDTSGRRVVRFYYKGV